jgi:hypothetical protein
MKTQHNLKISKIKSKDSADELLEIGVFHIQDFYEIALIDRDRDRDACVNNRERLRLI